MLSRAQSVSRAVSCSAALRSVASWSDVKDKKIVIFGASTGFLGRYVVEVLAKRNVQCVIPTRGDMDEMRHLKILGAPGKIAAIPFYPRDEESIMECMHGAYAVINLMGKYYETKHLLPWHINFRQEDVNVRIPQTLARLARDMKIPYFIHCSALQQNVHHPSNWCRTKAVGERAVRDEYPEAIIVRPADMFGYEDRLLNWYAQIHRWMPSLMLIDGGYAKKQPVWVADVADGIMKIVENISAYRGETFEFAGPQVKSAKEIVEYVIQQCQFSLDNPEISSSLARKIAYLCEWFPNPRLVRDDIDKMIQDNVISPSSTALQFKDLSMQPTALEKEGRGILAMYRLRTEYRYQYFAPPTPMNKRPDWNQV